LIEDETLEVVAKDGKETRKMKQFVVGSCAILQGHKLLMLKNGVGVVMSSKIESVFLDMFY
jgi:hypothetical protein